MVAKIEYALELAGYDVEPTTENLIQCYLDYADQLGGYIDDLKEEIEEGELTVNMMCNSLIRYCR